MLSSITDVAQVRTLGGLSTEESTGSANVAMVRAAIEIARLKMRKAVSREVYDAVRSFTSGDLTDAAKKSKRDDFATGEAYFALSALPAIAKNQQLGQNGLATQTVVGQGTVQFATTQDDTAIEAFWEKKAYEALADYLINALAEDPDDFDSGIESDDGNFSVTAI